MEPKVTRPENANPESIEPEVMDVISLYAILGIPKERAKEIYEEIADIREKSKYIIELANIMTEKYDRESLIAGVFLGEMILKNEGRLLPRGMDIGDIRVSSGGMTIEKLGEIEDMAREICQSIEKEQSEENFAPDGDPENN